MDTLELIDLRPTKNRSQLNGIYLGDKVRIAFPTSGSNKVKSMQIVLGFDVARTYGFKKGDKVFIRYVKNNPNIFFLTKELNNNPAWTLIENGKSLRVTIPWLLPRPENATEAPRFATVSTYEGMMKIVIAKSQYATIGNDEE